MNPTPRDATGDHPHAVSSDAWWMIASLTLALALWLYTANANVFWQDEYFSFDTAMRPLGDSFHQALHVELQPPLYFLTLHFWLKLGTTAVFGRALSLLFALLTVGVLTTLGRELGIRRPWLHLGIVAALTPTLVWAAAQSRTYSLAILFISCSMLLFVRIWILDRPVRPSAYFWYLLCAYAALLTNYYTGFVLAGQFLAAILLSPRRRTLLMSYGLLTVAFLPWIPTVLMQMRTHPLYYGPDPLTFARATLPETIGHAVAWAWVTTTQAVLRGPVVTRPVVAWALALAILAVVVLRLLSRNRPGRLEASLVITLAVPVAILLALRAFNLTYVGVRHWAVVVPVVLIVLVTLIDRVEPAIVRRLLAVGLLGALGAGLLSTQRNLSPYDWRGAGLFVRERVAPNEVVAVFPSHGLGPIAYYLGDWSRLHGIPAQDPLTSDLAISSVAELHRRFDGITGPRGTFWLVSGDVESYMGPEYLEEYLESVSILEHRAFRGMTVLHLQRP